MTKTAHRNDAHLLRIGKKQRARKQLQLGGGGCTSFQGTLFIIRTFVCMNLSQKVLQTLTAL